MLDRIDQDLHGAKATMPAADGLLALSTAIGKMCDLIHVRTVSVWSRGWMGDIQYSLSQGGPGQGR